MNEKHEYMVKRKLQEQSGSYFVVLPKLWVQSRGLKQGDEMSVRFNGGIKVEPIQQAQSEERPER